MTIDGVVDAVPRKTTNATFAVPYVMEWIYIPTAGSHLFNPQNTGAGSATCTMGTEASINGHNMEFQIEELVIQNVANNSVTSG